MAQILNMFDDVEAPEELAEETPSSPSSAPAEAYDTNGNNPPTTRALEVMNERVPGTPEPEPQVQLVSVFGDGGKVSVAKAVNGKRIEQWRAPTREEWHLLQTRGRLVRGGLAAAPEAPAPAAPPPAPAPSIMPKLLVGGAVLAAAGMAYYLWKQNKEMEENVEELD